MKTNLLPSTAWAIVDTMDNTVMEQSGTGQLNLFYARADAETAFPAVKAGSEAPTAKRLAIVEVRLSEITGRQRNAKDWKPIDTAPKGGGAERTDDPKWVEPPRLLVVFADGSLGICYWDWYYAPGGRGHTPGVSAWIGESGEQVARFKGDPVAWMPLPEAPKR